MTDVELLALATKIRDAVWQLRQADQLPPESVELAMDTRELWQELTSRLLPDLL